LAAASAAACALGGDLQAFAVGAGLGLLLAAEGGAAAVALAAAGIAAGALAAGVQLAPSWAYLHLTTRAAAPAPEDLVHWSFSPWRALELVAPGFFIRPEDGYSAPVHIVLARSTRTGITFAASVYVGAAVLALAALGARASAATRRVAAAGAVLVWLALGPLLGAQQLSLAIPVLGNFRYPEKYVGALGLCLAVLAALGADALRERGRARRVAFAALGVAAALAGTLPLLESIAAHVWPAVAKEAAAHLRSGLPHAALTMAGVALCGFASWRGFPRAALGGLAFVIWAGAAAASGYALRPGDPAARLSVPGPALAGGTPGPRVHAPFAVRPREPRARWDSFDEVAFAVASVGGPAFNVAQGIDNLAFYSGFPPARYVGVRDAFGPDWPRAARRFALTHVLLPANVALDDPSITATITGGTAVGTEPRTGAAVVAVPHREWASFPERVELAASTSAALARLVALHSSGDRAAVVEASRPLRAGAGRVLSIVRERERVTIEAEALGDAVLVVNDAFWPGWSATIDGKPVPIFPADGFVRAVPWPAGRHRLAMTYAPPELATGVAISIAGLLSIALASWALRRRVGAALRGSRASRSGAAGGTFPGS
jgi:hypothetical protein